VSAGLAVANPLAVELPRRGLDQQVAVAGRNADRRQDLQLARPSFVRAREQARLLRPRRRVDRQLEVGAIGAGQLRVQYRRRIRVDPIPVLIAGRRRNP